MRLGGLVWSLLLAVLAVVGENYAEAACTTARVRKNWSAMTTAERNTYRGALAAAMDSGAYIKFVEMHTEMKSELEAHRQCMFIYWHRLLLVAFENMLRDQGPQYECVTLPYWDWITAQSRANTGTCKSLGTCSTITTGLGGWTNGTSTSLTINGVTGNSGVCVKTSPLNHFCESGSKKGSACAKCVPRGKWNTSTVPASASYASVRNQLFSAANIGQMSPLIERGCHNNVHANLGGTMGTLASPSDPIFWSHHSMVDALHTIFHKCRVGTNRLTFAQKAANTVAWTSCERRNNGGPFNPADIVTMRTGVNGVNPINGSTDNLIGKYFAGVPNRFADLMDIRDLGTSSYSYEFSSSSFLATMYNNCASSPTTMRRMTAYDDEEGTVQAYDDSTSQSYADDMSASQVEGIANITNPYGPKVGSSSTSASSNDDTVGGEADSPIQQGDAYSTDSSTYSDNSEDDDVVVDDGKVDVVIKEAECEISPSIMMDWYDTTLENLGGDTQDNRDQLEYMACAFEDRCLGGTAEYSDEFKEIWGVTTPRCKEINDALNAGDISIKHENWQEKMEGHFGCPVPSTPAPTPAATKTKHSMCY